MKRILQISIGSTVFGGVEKMIYEIYKNIDKNKFQFDFLSPNYTTYGMYREEIETAGGKIIEFKVDRNKLKGKLLYNKRLYQFLKKNKYEIVHINSGVFLFVLQVAMICRMAGVKKIIVHSHNAINYNLENKLKKYIINILKPLLKIFATDYLACSELAAQSMFSKEILKNVKIIKNGIDVNKYKFNIDIRNKYRQELNIENSISYIHVGRFERQKNHKFLIDVFYEIQKIQNNAKLILIGEGQLQETIIAKVKELKIEDKVIFLNQRKDVGDLLHAGDCFILPSLYEGLPVVGIEAQTSGLPLICSDTITRELKLLDTTTFYSLGDKASTWSEKICKITNSLDLKSREDSYKLVQDKGYDIKMTANDMERIYN